jgi:Fe-S cluster assembly protein SufD
MITLLSKPPAEPQPLAAPLAAFEQFEREAARESLPWLRSLRTSGISYFAELGFPTSAMEDWRFTNPAPLAAFPFVPALRPSTGPLVDAALARFDIPGLEAHRLVFVDGHFAPGLSHIRPTPPETVISNLAEAARSAPALVASCVGRVARHEANALTALNTAFVQDGAFICLPPNLDLETPVHLLFVASRPGTVIQPRNVIVARAHSRLRVIEDYVSLTESASFTNTVTEIMAGAGSRIEHLKLQRENTASLHVAAIEARQHRESHVLSHSVSFGAALARNHICLRFDEGGCEGILNGLYLAAGEQLVDHHTVADHAHPRCNSREFYHGILGGKARGVFNGRIFVRPDAQKTDAKQTNRNLLLSNEATVNTKPQLEIFADDVKCTHGATVGQLDEEAAFYLRSRGLGEDQARLMLLRAFAGDVLGRIEVAAARRHLEQFLDDRLGRLLSPVTG